MITGTNNKPITEKLFVMLKLKFFVPLFSLGILLGSCHGHGTLHIVINNGGDYHMDIKRAGWVEFSKDTTAINRISENGYLSFEKNGKRLRAEYDNKGVIYIEMYENGKLISNEQGKTFLAEAVKEMVNRNVGRVEE